MKVNLQKKKAITAAMLLTMCCYGQAWAEEFADKNVTIAAGAIKTIGTAGEDLTIKNSNISLGDGATLKIEGKNIRFKENNSIEGKGTVEIAGTNSNAIDFLYDAKLSINADIVHIKTYYNDDSANITWNGLSINQNEDYKKGTVQIDGPILVAYLTGMNNCNGLEINFYGEISYLNGGVESMRSNDDVNLTFDQSAKWYLSVDSFIDNLDLLNSSKIEFQESDKTNTLYLDKFGVLVINNRLNADKGIIKMNFDGSKKIEAAENYTGYNGDFVVIHGTHTGDTGLILKNTSNDTSKVNDRVLVMVKDEQGSFNVKETEGALSWENYKLEKKQVNPDDYILNYSTYANNTAELSAADETWTGWTITDITRRSAPTTSTKTLLSTITAGYDTWRNDTDKFNERMGELRMNGAGNEGVWVRTKGSEFGRHSSNGSYTNKQQTYQLGYDAVTSKDEKQTTYTGVAAEYGKGSLTFDSGTGTMKSMGLGVYQSQLRESGHYLDLTYRFDKYKNDFHVADSMGNPISGKYGNNAMSLSAEYGRKNALKHGWYVEPQSEVTLGYMFGNDFTTSNNIRVEQKNMPALIGRLGLNIGREVSDKVNFYVKASVNHDFLGNYDMHMTDMSTGERLNESDKFGSSWFDYGAGLSVKTGKDNYAYFDIERAVGGEYKKNWDWNAGVRWSF